MHMQVKVTVCKVLMMSNVMEYSSLSCGHIPLAKPVERMYSTTVISNFFDTSDGLLDFQLLKYRYTAHHCEVPVQPLYIATGMTGSSADEIHFTIKSVL